MHKGFNRESKLNGKEFGRKENSMVIAKKLLDMGLSIEQIIEAKQLSKEEIEKLKH